MRKKAQGASKPGADNESVNTNVVAVRPATPNDFAIVATVRSLQHLVNIESKWKFRVQDAERSSHMNGSKIDRITATIESSKECLGKIAQELEELIASLPGTVKIDASAAIVAGGTGAGGGRKSKAALSTSMLGGEENPVVTAQRRVREECAAIGAVMRAFYRAPRLAKERPNAPPDTPMEMRRELEEVSRVTSPDLSLAASFKPPPPAPKKAVAKPSKDPKKGGVVEVDQGPERVYGLLPSDVFSLPRPSCINAQLFHKVMLLRSRRLRVEGSIDMLESGLAPLKKRTQCLANMQALGGYSIHAVTPLIAAGYDEESSLQKIRAQEDEQFMKRMKAAGK